jgi:hypothetical protein
MTVPFDPNAGAILVEARLAGPTGIEPLLLVLDTGSTCTMVSEARLRFVGCNLSQPLGHVRAVFGGGVQTLPVIPVVELSTLGISRANYPVVCHTLPPSAGVDGVLGLDFFPGHVLTIDFVNSTVDLA